MPTASYESRRGQLETYFDRTAVEAWKRLTSDAPVSGVRATVRAGRDRMRGILLDWLPADLTGKRVLDAGCGTGALAVEAARRGAEVMPVDISASLVDLARDRAAGETAPGSVDFRVGDMLDPAFGTFDHVVAMDSLIHYDGEDILRVLSAQAARTRGSIVFTVAPRTALLTVMHATGKLFPRGDRSPAIQPISPDKLAEMIAREPRMAGWRCARGERVSSGFYISQAMEVIAE